MDCTTEFSFLIGPVYRRWVARLNDRLRDYGLTRSRWLALWQLSLAPEGLSQQELADRIGVEAPTIVRLMDALQALALIERRTCPSDRRAWRIHLTPEAQPILDVINEEAAGLRAELFVDIPEDDLRAAVEVMRRLRQKLDGQTRRAAAA